MEAELANAYRTRVVLVSPPRTGSTAVARLLWQHSMITHHCHEPFEACYWGDGGTASVESCLRQPMVVDTGERVALADVAPGSGLLVKEMSFQLSAAQFEQLTRIATAPPVFVMSDPRLSTTSRLRIVRELSGTSTFPPFESGWQSLHEQLEFCRRRDIPYVLVDSDDLRADPTGMTTALTAAVGLPPADGLEEWVPRPGLQLCSPEVGALMSEVRRSDDPFYRKVLGSTGIQPRGDVDWDREDAAISAAGLADDVAKWLDRYQEMRADPALVAGPRGKQENNAHAV
ncbi:hypothetical protein [Umezawaea tangerina]|uniref:Sulfotransferase family protein n=1 Tax=Umezawaea tangerina TaxID=84725 RepID=A0A2T0TGQ3_9PSEU|nr:hypothetical protein [Umezawaea tangerina]PRY44805.1 hypothetical protein CLV43_102370 [Umezawaea tangerina]